MHVRFPLIFSQIRQQWLISLISPQKHLIRFPKQTFPQAMRQFGNPTKPLNGTLGYPSIPNPNHQKFRTHRKNSHFPNKSEEPSNSLAKSETFRATFSWFPKNVRTTSEARCVYSLLFSKGSTLQIETKYMEKKHIYIYTYSLYIHTNLSHLGIWSNIYTKSSHLLMRWYGVL